MNEGREIAEQLSKQEKRARKKELRAEGKQEEKKVAQKGKMRNIVIIVVVFVAVAFGYKQWTQKSPEEVVFEQEVETVSLEGKVEEFEIEGSAHLRLGETAEYGTNPPTSGDHLANPADWRFYDRELDDAQMIHNLEHGGIWISYKGLDEESVDRLKDIAKKNSNSVIVTKREANDDAVVVASWGKMMRLAAVDEAFIQKFIDTHINQSPEQLAR